ncbi:MAG TPA: hypothetical protein VEV87_10885, partial [Chitinophagaceae bacterium]|nr:hypothetical protein [Chitinophagaceae bacterium]
LFLSFQMISCAAQMKGNVGVLKGRVDIGPICPQEPCNPTPERLKQVYDSYEVVLLDTGSRKILFRIPILQDASFNNSISAGAYLVKIKPVNGEGFRTEEKRISIEKGKTTIIQLAYDTGLR